MSPSDPPEREGPTSLERLVFFSDAVVAIAITLVALPLVDNARELEGSGLDFLVENRSDLIAAGISFAVIAAFWFDHHRLFDRATRRVPGLLRVNMLWLAGIVALPVATVVQVRSVDDDRGALAIYVGTIVFLMAVSRLQEFLLVRAGALHGRELDRRSVIDELVPLVLVGLALTIGLLWPPLGTIPLLLLLVSRPLRILLGRIVSRTPER